MGATQGNDPPDGSQGKETPQGLTLEDVNRAITGRLKDFQKAISKDQETLSQALLSKLDEHFSKRFEEMKPREEEPKKKGAESEISEHPLVKGLQKRTAEIEAQLKAAQAETKAEKEKRRDVALRTQVGDALVKGGIDPKYVKHAIGILVDSEKRVRHAEDSDQLIFRDGDEEVDFATGLKSWLKSDDAKVYMPPRGTAGSGSRTGGAPSGPQGQQPNIGELLADALGYR